MRAAIRPARADDAAAITALFKRGFTDTFAHLYSAENLDAFLAGRTPEKMQRELGSPDFAIRVAEADGRMVGYVKLGPPTLPFEPNGRAIELRQLYLLKDWQGAGLGEQLMDWAIDEAMRRGMEEMYLSVFIDNHRARRFYERYGFEPVGKYDFMVGDHADEDIVMRRRL